MKHDSSGYTIVEVIVAALIISISAAAATMFFSYSSRSYRKAVTNSAAAMLASNEAERLNFISVSGSDIRDTSYTAQCGKREFKVKRETAAQTVVKGCRKIEIKVIDGKSDSIIYYGAALVKGSSEKGLLW